MVPTSAHHKQTFGDMPLPGSKSLSRLASYDGVMAEQGEEVSAAVEVIEQV
jgi:hypothetical protein